MPLQSGILNKILKIHSIMNIKVNVLDLIAAHIPVPRAAVRFSK